MANAFFDQVWVIDTASASNITTDDPIVLESVRWVGGTTAGHTATIADAAGNVIWSAVATGANYTEESDVPMRVVGGIRVPTLASGVLYLYHKTE